MKDKVHGRLPTPVKWVGLLALLAGIGSACEAHAACRQVCTPQTSCDGLSGEERWRCVAGRSGETNSCRTVCSDSYGAIAHSRQTGSWGHSFDHGSQAGASRIALAHCTRAAPDCRVVANFTNQCGAIAETEKGDVRPGLGSTKKEAEGRSLTARRSSTGKTCKVVTSVCSVK